MKRLIAILILLHTTIDIFCQEKFDRLKAEDAVTKYLSIKWKNYNSISFGELFDQTYPKEVQEKLKTKEAVVYSIVHTYSTGDKKHVDDYFHLDKDYNVIGVLTDKEMMKITSEFLQKSGKLDSIMNTIDLPKD